MKKSLLFKDEQGDYNENRSVNIVCAPDSFKGSLEATQVASAMEEGALTAIQNVKVNKLPLSDGGEGLAASLVTSTGGKWGNAVVSDPLGRKVSAGYGILGDGQTGVLEMAAASGLPLLRAEELNPLQTSTYGTGELIIELLNLGCTKVIIGIGGSATNDGGLGMLKALGGEIFDHRGNALAGKGEDTLKLAKIDLTRLDPRIKGVEFISACDVDNPLLGPQGAARVYAPQKGADAKKVELLEKGMENLAQVIYQNLNVEIAESPGAGAAGGLGAGIQAFLGGRLVSGIELVLDTINIDFYLPDADLVITGEGTLDAQTIFGKVPFGVAKRAKQYQVPVVALAGHCDKGASRLHEFGLTAYFSISPGACSQAYLMNNAYELVKNTSYQVVRLISL